MAARAAASPPHALRRTAAAAPYARARRAQDGARPGASAGAADAPPDAPPEPPPEAPRPPPVRLRAFSWARRLRDGVSGALELDAPSPEPPASAGPAGAGRARGAARHAGGAAWASAGSPGRAWDSAPSPAVTPRRASFPCGAPALPRPFPGPDAGAAQTPVRRCPSLAAHPLPEPISAATSMRSVGSLLDDDVLPASVAPCPSQSASPGPGPLAERAGAPGTHALAPGSADSSAAALPAPAPAAGAARAPDAALLASFGSLVDAFHDEDAPAGGAGARHGAMPPAASCSLGAGSELEVSAGAAALGARGRTSSAPLLDGWGAEGGWDAFPPAPAAGEPGGGRAGARVRAPAALRVCCRGGPRRRRARGGRRSRPWSWP